jgi:hypothetical protein
MATKTESDLEQRLKLAVEKTYVCLLRINYVYLECRHLMM